MQRIIHTWRKVFIIISISNIFTNIISRIYQLFHNLSLDVVLGSAGSYAFACKALNQPVSVIFALIIGISVWIIYLTDHFLDSLKPLSTLSRKYEMFIQYRKKFLLILILLVLVDVLLVVKYLPFNFVFNGILLCLFLGLYLVAQHFLKGKYRMFFPKEITISIIYILAVWFFPLMLSERLPLMSVLLLLSHFLLVLTNVTLFSFFERSEDNKSSRLSAFSFLTKVHIKLLISMLCIITLLSAMAVWAFFQSSASVFVLIVLSAIYLLEIYFSDSKLMRNCYPEITDGAFLLFLILLF